MAAVGTTFNVILNMIKAPILAGNVGQLESLYESLDDNQHIMGCLAIIAARYNIFSLGCGKFF